MTYLYFFVSGRVMMGLSIAPTPMWEVWRPTLQRVAASSVGNRMVVVNPFLSGVVPLGSVASSVAAVASALAAIPVLMADVVLEVTLAAPPPPVEAEVEGETELPASPIGGMHGSPSRSEPKALGRRGRDGVGMPGGGLCNRGGGYPVRRQGG